MAGLDPIKRTNAEFPGGVAGGVIEGVKRAVMVALKDGLRGTTLSGEISGSDVTVDMEYPMEAEHYPGVWVQFSFTEFMNAGVGHEVYHFNEETQGHELIREFQFRGTVNLTIVALTNLERDRLADSIVTMLLFSRMPEYVLTKPNEDTKQFRALQMALAQNPYIAMTIDSDQLSPGGQSVTPGVPWDDQLMGYEDNYSFSILGQSNIVFRHDGSYSLRAIDVVSEQGEPGPDRFDWQ